MQNKTYFFIFSAQQLNRIMDKCILNRGTMRKNNKPKKGISSGMGLCCHTNLLLCLATLFGERSAWDSIRTRISDRILIRWLNQYGTAPENNIWPLITLNEQNETIKKILSSWKKKKKSVTTLTSHTCTTLNWIALNNFQCHCECVSSYEIVCFLIYK